MSHETAAAGMPRGTPEPPSPVCAAHPEPPPLESDSGRTPVATSGGRTGERDSALPALAGRAGNPVPTGTSGETAQELFIHVMN